MPNKEDESVKIDLVWSNHTRDTSSVQKVKMKHTKIYMKRFRKKGALIQCKMAYCQEHKDCVSLCSENHSSYIYIYPVTQIKATKKAENIKG